MTINFARVAPSELPPDDAKAPPVRTVEETPRALLWENWVAGDRDAIEFYSGLDTREPTGAHRASRATRGCAASSSPWVRRVQHLAQSGRATALPPA